MKKRLATLDARENSDWIFAFNYYKEQGLSDSAADEKAWTDMQVDHPRLQAFDGAKP